MGATEPPEPLLLHGAFLLAGYMPWAAFWGLRGRGAARGQWLRSTRTSTAGTGPGTASAGCVLLPLGTDPASL
jgi:hypothetical protein